MSKIIRQPEVLRLVSVSADTLRRWERAGSFPKRFKLNPDARGVQGAAGWHERDVLAWLDARKGASEPKIGA